MNNIKNENPYITETEIYKYSYHNSKVIEKHFFTKVDMSKKLV